MKIFKVVLCFITLACFTLGVCFSGAWQKGKSLDLNPITYQGIIKVWHIDTFEGGVGSRKQFLLDSGVTFEKKYKGVLIMVSNHTIYSAEENFSKGVYPDLISYGVGFNLEKVCNIKTDTPLSVCSLGDKEYASVWCKGAYFLIENEKYKGKDNLSLTVSKSEYTNPLVAIMDSDKKFNIVKVEKPLDAYINFINGNSKYLLGTQRDIVRLTSRGFDYKAEPLQDFSDLNQFISVVSDSEEKRYYSEQFVKHLISKETQEKLKNISMFSAFYSVENDNEILRRVTGAKIQKGISPFMKKEVIKELYSLSSEYLKNRENELQIKINNLMS